MRLRSTPESVRAGEVTWLALLETVLATGVAVYVAAKHQTVAYIVIGACLSPFALLRSEKSSKLAWYWYTTLYDWWSSHATPVSGGFLRVILGNFLAFAGLPVLVLSIRVASGLVGVMRWPIDSLRAIPANWARTVLALDVRQAPQPLPPPTPPVHQRYLNDISLSYWFRAAHSWVSGSMPLSHVGTFLIVVLYLLLTFVLGLMLFVPAWAYRWSVKATSILYLPLIWVVRSSWPTGVTLRDRLEDFQHSKVEQLKRWYAGFVIVGLTVVPVAVFLWWHATLAALADRVGLRIVNFVLFTGEIEMWHVARLVNAAITVGVWLFADAELRGIQRGRGHTEESVGAVISTASFVRGLLGFYLVAVGLCIFATEVDWSTVHFRFVWWPHR